MAQDPSPLSPDAYRLLFEGNPHPILLVEVGTWCILAANAAAARLYGWSTDELACMTVLEIRPESERERFLAHVPSVPDGLTHVGRFIHQARDGRRIDVDITSAGLRLDDGRHARLSVITDITTLRELEETRERLAAVVTGSHDAIILTDLRGRIQSWNAGAEHMFGYAEAEARGRAISLIHPPGGDGPTFRDMASDVVAGRAVRMFDAEGRTKDGRSLVLSMTLSPVCDAAGAVVGISGIERDVTERREADRAMRESQARFARLFRSELILAAVVDVRAEQITDVSDTWLRFFGMKAEDVASVSVDDFGRMWQDAAQFAALTRAWQNREPIRGIEVGFRTRSGLRYALLSVHPGADGEDLVVMVDITDRRRLEAELSEARRLEALGRLAGGIAHDFNNMLSVMSGYAELLEEQLPEAGGARGDLQEIRRAADRATMLTRQLLAFGRRQMLQPRTIDLNAVIAGTETFLQRVLGERLTLQLALAPGALWVEADPSQIEQVLLNLASNARDAVDGPGVVQVTTRTRTLGRGWARDRGLPAGPAAELAVRDTGRGMDPETLQHIFEPFFTTKDVGNGTGLGLATVHGIVKQSGGHVEASSTPGQGSLFRVLLPLVSEPGPAPDAPQPERVAGGSETILLVEDEPAVATLTESLLRRMGYRVLMAHSANEAIAHAKGHAGTIDLLLSDVVMPGASGRDLVEALQPSRPDMKVLYMSGYPADAVVRHGIADGEAAFLQKPFTMASLGAKVREALG